MAESTVDFRAWRNSPIVQPSISRSLGSLMCGSEYPHPDGSTFLSRVWKLRHLFAPNVTGNYLPGCQSGTTWSPYIL